MMMKKLTTILVLSALLLATGCANASAQAPGAQPGGPEASISEPQSQPEAAETSEAEESDMAQAPAADPFEGLTLNEYDGLEVTAAVLPRMAILPGAAIPVTVTVTNNGDKTIAYTLGSGVHETPQALVARFDGLQPVLPKDHLGPATMDFVTKELAPGESLQYVVTVMAVEPSAAFDNYTYDLYNKDQAYIAELDWPALQELHPDLTAAEAGSYTGTVSFRYTVPAEDGAMNGLSGPTGYNQAELTVSVNG